jgi:dipeptidyl aminopeptidase/acylaminoacyl peptidase
MKRFLLVGSIFLLLSSSTAQVKRAFTIEDLYRVRSVDDPQCSPRGGQMAFTVSSSHLKEGTTFTNIFTMDTRGGNLRQMTFGPSIKDHPRWSADGRTLYYLRTEKNHQQLWALPADGGEPRLLSAPPMGITDPVVTPNGRSVVFTAEVFPECGADTSCNTPNQEGLDRGPLKAYLADHLLYRHWTSWKEGKRSHILMQNFQDSSLRDLSPGDYDAPSFSLGGVGFALSPDGSEVCFVSNHDSVEATSTNEDLWLVPLSGGGARNITAENKAYDGDPAYSPDGRYIAYRTQRIPGYESDRFLLALYDRSNTTKTVLTEGFDNWVDKIQWAPDSKSIYFTADVKGHVPLFRVEISSKKITPVIDLKTIDAFVPSPDGKTLALIRRSVSDPRELWVCSSTGKDPKQMTFFNKEVEDAVDFRPAEELWIPSPTGALIQTFVVKPHLFDPSKKYPLILNVHGGPQSQWEDAFRGDWQVYPGSGYIVAFPNPHGSTGEGQQFTAEISRDWNGKVYQDIMAVSDSLSHISWVDADRMGAMGWSFGGYMMMWLEGHTTRFKAIAAMMGVYDLTAMHGATEELWFPEWDLGGDPWTSDLYQRLSPNNSVKNFQTPCLVITGEQDFRVPYTQSLEFFTDLQLRGVPSRLIVFKNDGHWPSTVKSMPFYYNAHLDWFHRYLHGAAAPYDMVKMLRNQADLGE